MKISLSQIRAFLEIDVPVQMICEKLTLLGIEVDSVLNPTPPFSGVVVGEVISTKPHPKAEKLQIAQVHNGKEILSIVCGAPNCRAGLKTALATIGALLPNGDNAPLLIAKTTIRGEDSYGMLCSALELALWKEESGILELPSDWENGKDLVDLLWDPVFECSLTPNLGHCLSALGIARELSVAFQKPLKPLAAKKPLTEKTTPFQVHVETSALAPRYMAQKMGSIKVGPSPFWLQKILLQCGMKPICNVVDVTNFILLQFGQPLHAFDADLIAGKKIFINTNPSQEKWTGLDSIAREIPENTLLISDSEKRLAIAGILGGQNSAVSASTKEIVLEAAHFDPNSVRKTSKKMGLRTESAIRFEKGVDPNGVSIALQEATRLLSEIAGAVPIGAPIDVYPNPIERKTIPLRPDKVNKMLGTKLSVSEMEQILTRLDCHIGKSFAISPPTYRFDLHEEIDLIEEIARVYGYNNIEKGFAKSTPSLHSHDPLYLFETKVRSLCVAQGLQEFLHCNLISPKMAELCPEITFAKGIQLLKAAHAKTEEYSILRPSLLSGLLTTAKTNLDLKNQNWKAFEIGKVHFLQNKKNIELPMLAFLFTGMQAPQQWGMKKEPTDFYTLKGTLENIFQALHLPAPQFQASKHSSFHPGRHAEIHMQNVFVGTFGEIHPELLAKADIKQRMLFGEFHLEHLMHLSIPKTQFRPIPHLPSSERDWTISLPIKQHAQTILDAIQKHARPILEKFDILDIYTPEGQDLKNITIRFTYRDLLKTISFEEVEKEHGRLLAAVTLDISRT